jgi:hypothetical protein
MNNPGVEAVRKLAHLGYRFTVIGENIKAKYEGPGDPDPSQVQPLLEAVRADKDSVRAYLKTLVLCQDCAHAQVGLGWAICQVDPWDGIRGQVPSFQHPCPNFMARTKPLPPPEKILFCRDCPWYQLNPWTHYPELGAWCHYHMDHLLIDNPQCIGYRGGEVQECGKEEPLSGKTVCELPGTS